jgi:hypothetical protein
MHACAGADNGHGVESAIGGLAIARGHAQQLLARLGCVDVCRPYRNEAHVGDAVLAFEAPTLLIASDRGI